MYIFTYIYTHIYVCMYVYKRKNFLKCNFFSILRHTHIIAVQIQDTDGVETFNKIWDLCDPVPAQVQFIQIRQLLNALRHRRDVFETEVQAPFPVQGTLHVALGPFQGDGLTFWLRAGSLSLGHVAAGQTGQRWRL